MNKYKKYFISVLVSLISFGLGGLVLLTVVRLRQEAPVAPTAPQKQFALEGSPVPECVLTIDLTPPTSPQPSPAQCIIVDKVVDGICQEGTVTLTVNDICAETVRAPLDLMLVLDRSESMGRLGGSPPRPLYNSQVAANLLIDQLDSSLDRVGLVSYGLNETAQLEIGMTADFNAVKNQVNSLTPVGGTNIGEAMFQANQEMATNHRQEAVPVIILLTDGVANNRHNGSSCEIWPTQPNECTQDAINQAQVSIESGSNLFTIGLNLDEIDPNLTPEVSALARSTLQQMVTSLDYYYESPTPEDLIGVFNDLAQVITTISASDIIITEILPAGVSYVPGTASIEPTSINGQTLIWDIGTMVNTDSITITFDVVFETLEPNQLVDVYPDSQVDYLDTLNNPQTVVFPETFFTPELCVSPSPGASASPSPSPIAQCVMVKVYQIINGEWILVTNLSQLQPGDTVYFAVLGSTNTGTFDMARFRINGIPADWGTTTLTNPFGEFYYQYTIPVGVTSFYVESEIHHTTMGWR